MDKEAKEVFVFFASIAFVLLVFSKLAVVMFSSYMQNDEIVEVKKEVLDKIEKQNEEIIKLLHSTKSENNKKEK